MTKSLDERIAYWEKFADVDPRHLKQEFLVPLLEAVIADRQLRIDEINLNAAIYQKWRDDYVRLQQALAEARKTLASINGYWNGSTESASDAAEYAETHARLTNDRINAILGDSDAKGV